MNLEGAPVLCKRCGAPTEVQPNLAVQCRFCGLPDRLPNDELGRVLEVRGRLAMATARVAQLASSEAALASIFERRSAFWSVMGPFPFLALGIIAYAISSAYSTLENLPAAVPTGVRVDLVVAASYAPFFIVGITVSLPIALLVGRLSYAKNVRPRLLARPPKWNGAPMRCRACGGELAPAREAFCVCRYCQTQNIVASEVARDAARHLDAELAAYHAQASGVLTSTSRASTNMTRTVTICFAAVYLGMFVLGSVARVVLPALL